MRTDSQDGASLLVAASTKLDGVENLNTHKKLNSYPDSSSARSFTLSRGRLPNDARRAACSICWTVGITTRTVKPRTLTVNAQRARKPRGRRPRFIAAESDAEETASRLRGAVTRGR